MNRIVRLLIVTGVAAASIAATSATVGLREQVRLQEMVLDGYLGDLADQSARMQEAWSRVDRATGDLVRALEQGESLDSLRLRSEDLRQAESDLDMLLLDSQRIRGQILGARMLIAAAEEEIRRLEGEPGEVADPLTGTWRLAVEPGGLEGTAYLQLEGTLVQGTYELAGGWSGSFRGTLVARKVRLERIDSRIGFAAIFYGRLVDTDEGPRLQGTWEATQLARGLPSSGTWISEKVSDAGGE